MKYDKNTSYALRVTGTLITGDYHYYLTEDQGMKFRVKMLHFQQALPAPETIQCIVSGYDADGSPVFIQCKAEVAHQLYALDGSVYSFTVSKKLASPGGHRSSYRGYDANGINVNIQVSGESKLTLGRSVKGIVRHIDSEGNLTVVPVGQSQEDETNFLTYAQLMHNIQVAEPPTCLTLETLRTLKDKKAEQMLAQYDSCTGLWIVSYLAVIREQRNRAITRGDLDAAQTLIRHKLRIIEWMLEDSLFLTYYSPELVGPLRQKCEREADYGETMLQAIALTRQGEAEAYLQKMFTKINTTGYLYDRERKTALLIALMQANPLLPERHTTDFIGFCHYMTNDDNTDPNNLDALSELLRQITETDAINGSSNNPRLILRLLSVRLLMNRNRLDASLSVCYSRLLRCACLLSPAARQVLMGKALHLLVCPNTTPAPEFGWSDLLEFNTDIFIAKLSTEISLSEENFPPAHHTFRNGTLLLRQGVFHLYAGCSSGALAEYQKQAEIISLLDGQVKVTSLKEFKPKMNERQNLLALKKNWEGLYRLLRLPAPSPAPVVQEKVAARAVAPEVGTTVTIRLNAFNPRYPLLMFAEIIDPDYKGTGVLLASDVSRYHVRSLENVFYQDDTFTATVVRAEEGGRLTFGIAEELFDMVQRRLPVGKQVRAKLSKITPTAYIWVAEDGYSVHTPTPPSSYRLSVDDIALVRIASINAQGYINGIFLERSDIDIDPTEALGKLVAEYVDYCACQNSDDEQEEESDQDDDLTDDLDLTAASDADKEVLPLSVIHELVQLLNALQEIEPSLSIRYQLLSAARLLAVLTDDALLVEQLSLRMNYEENIYSFATCPPKTHWEDFLRIDDPTVKRFPTLAPCLERIRVLRLFHDYHFDPTLAAKLSQPMDAETSHIIRLVLGHSLMHHTLRPEALKDIHHELLRRIGAGELVTERPLAAAIPEAKTELYHLGRESGEVEFKSSIVYPAGKTMPNMKQQSDVILRTIAGLLNAEGGVLHIGVADSGNVSGLANDYSYMECTSDGYERYIRQRIITLLGKDVNGIIRIDFPSYGKHETCRISVPCHGKLVELEGAVFQRQGNSTVQLVGNSLLKQQLRKQEALKTELKTLKADLKTIEAQTAAVAPTAEPTKLVSELLQGAGTAQTAVAAAFAASLERKSKKTQPSSTGKKNSSQALSTSRIRPNPVGKNKQGSDMEIQAYLTLLDNGGYLLTDELPRKLDSPSLLTLAIGEHEAGGSLLLCYDNACVNRIPLKALLQKKRGYIYKNGANKEAKLQWASVENGEPYLLVRIQKFANTHLKMMPMERIKTSTDLTLKGTPFYSFDFGQVTGWETIPDPEAQKLLRLVNENLAQPGVFTTSEAVADEMQLLAVLGF